jgi:hypothetical protein
VILVSDELPSLGVEYFGLTLFDQQSCHDHHEMDDHERPEYDLSLRHTLPCSCYTGFAMMSTGVHFPIGNSGY